MKLLLGIILCGAAATAFFPRSAGASPEEEVVLGLTCAEETVALAREIPLEIQLVKKKGRPVTVNSLRLARNSVTLLVTYGTSTHEVTRIYGREVRRADDTFVLEDETPPKSVLRRVRPLHLDLPVLALRPGKCSIQAVYTGMEEGRVRLESEKVEIEITAEAGRNRIGAVLETSEGAMTFELWPEEAFGTVLNFLTLAKARRYDGLTFHRIIRTGYIQGGDPKGDGTGRPDWTIPGEFHASIRHEKGVISMARAAPLPDSAGSQFFIMTGSDPRLDGKFAAFGRVVQGVDVLDRLASVRVLTHPKAGEVSWPEEPPIIRAIRLVTR